MLFHYMLKVFEILISFDIFPIMMRKILSSFIPAYSQDLDMRYSIERYYILEIHKRWCNENS
jgi:hypothetical protein